MENEKTINTNNEVMAEEINVNETQSPKDKVLKDGKISFIEFFDVARYFLPILTTIGWIIIFLVNSVSNYVSDFVTLVILIPMGIGFICALTVAPLKLLKFILKAPLKGFQIVRGFIPVYGLADLMAGVFGIGFGLIVGIVTVFGLPAAFTIPKFFRE